MYRSHCRVSNPMVAQRVQLGNTQGCHGDDNWFGSHLSGTIVTKRNLATAMKHDEGVDMKLLGDAAPVSIRLVPPRRWHRNELPHNGLRRCMLAFDGPVGAS
jgi:hypothetical protein